MADPRGLYPDRSLKTAQALSRAETRSHRDRLEPWERVSAREGGAADLAGC